MCRDGWDEGLVYDSGDQPIPVCLAVNREALPWKEAQDVCRKEYGFLIKLESPVTIGSRAESLLEHLHKEGKSPTDIFAFIVYYRNILRAPTVSND